jgi:POT family proton-dependent oligopeptide transporter
MAMTVSEVPDVRQIFGFPADLWTLGALKFCERYAYYVVLTLLPLLLTGDRAQGGFGWSTPEALTFTGFYFGVVHASPFLGGLLTDRFFTLASAVRFGLILLTAGHVVMVLPHIMTDIIGSAKGLPLSDALRQSAIPVAQFTPFSALAQVPEQMRGPLWLAQNASAAAFLLAAGLVALGNSFFKPNITLAVGRQSYRSEAERESGYMIFYMIINLGAAIAGIVSGLLAEAYGWHIALTSAIAGMAAGLMIFRWRARAIITRSQEFEAIPETHEASAFDRIELSLNPRAILALLFLAIFMYCIAFDQSAGLWALYIEQEMDRVVAGVAVPTTWALSLNPIFVVLLSPLVAFLWSRGLFFASNSVLTKFAIAFVLTAFSSLIFYNVAAMAAVGASITILWTLPIFFLLTAGEILIGPVGESAISRFAPPRYQSFVMGSWFGTIGLGGFAAGYVGSLSAPASPQTVFLWIAVMCLVTAGFLGTIATLFRSGPVAVTSE